MPGSVFRRGETVELRTIEEADAEFLRDLINEPRVRAGIANRTPMNLADEREWVDSLGGDDEANFLVCVDGDAVGTIGLRRRHEPSWGVWGVGYMLVPDAWGNGYATDALRETAAYAFDERRAAKLFATVYKTNPASARVLEKAGFVEEGVLRGEAFVDGERVDIVRYGLPADEWEDRP
ncbi:GNAT family N-acetyltransferase [Halobaculum gomorrense]|uniref:Protein N-acetyltransferase, RimJ/RimL family n=1 Tax=Halobaculum gomorrense TaxID=43928 RepID=A0A1M5L0E3_9EURY|nr:GNAT family protein [Halobaculum gomorrense]SHG57893.1 Protein N-acetyltransferase, RimJ/RimL family [Halobaculum gomorrense]